MGDNTGKLHANRRARPSKSIRQRMDVIINALRRGPSPAGALACAGINENTYSEWWNSFPKFAWEVVQAEAAFEVAMVQRVTSGKPGWQGPAWWLERQRGERWSKYQPTPAQSGPMECHVVYDPPSRCPRCGWQELSQRSDVDTEKGAQGEGRGELSTVVRPELESVMPTGESGGAQH
jgi:hypothetical protein